RGSKRVRRIPSFRARRIRTNIAVRAATVAAAQMIRNVPGELSYRVSGTTVTRNSELLGASVNIPVTTGVSSIRATVSPPTATVVAVSSAKTDHSQFIPPEKVTI